MSSHAVTSNDRLTVGELLADAERTARQLLSRPITTDGTSLPAGWDAVLAAAAVVLTTTLPRAHTTRTTTPTSASAATEGDDAAQMVAGLIARLAEEARALEVGQVPSRLHPGVVHLTQTWQQAAAAASQQPPPRHRNTPDPRDVTDGPDPKLLALRTVRTLAVVAHASQLALAGTGSGVAGVDRDEVDGLRRLLQRHEQLTLRSLRALTAAVPPGHVLSPGIPDDSPLDRLTVGLKQWSAFAIVAAADPSTPSRHLRRIAQIEAITTAAAAALVGAAGQRHDLPPEAVPHLQRRLKEASRHWETAADQWHWVRRFGPANSRPRASGSSPTVALLSQALAVAVADVHANVRALAGAQQGADRSDQPARAAENPSGLARADLVPVLRNITENSAILGEIFRRLPTRTHQHDDAGRLRPVLFAPERTLQQIAKETYTRDHDHLRPGSHVSPTALDLPVASRRGDDLRALTPEAADFLRTTGTDLARAANAAEQAVELATGVHPRWPPHQPNITPPAAHRPPAPPHLAGHPNPGIPR